MDDENFIQWATYVNSSFLGLVGTCPNDWHALGYGFIELPYMFLFYHLNTLSTNDRHKVSIGQNKLEKIS